MREHARSPNNTGAGWLPRQGVTPGKNENQIFPYIKIDIVSQSRRSALRYIPPLLDTAKFRAAVRIHADVS
jgi:hypothetical protein